MDPCSSPSSSPALQAGERGGGDVIKVTQQSWRVTKCSPKPNAIHNGVADGIWLCMEEAKMLLGADHALGAGFCSHSFPSPFSEAALWVAQQSRQNQSCAQQFPDSSLGAGPALGIATSMCGVTQTFLLLASYHLTSHEGAYPSLQRLSHQAWRSWSGLVGQETTTTWALWA